MSGSTSILDLITAAASARAVANALHNAASPAAIFARRDTTSAALTWGYYGGRFRKPDGSRIDVANGTIALSASATNYIEVAYDGTVSKNTSGFSTDKRPLYTVVTSGSAATSWTDERCGREADWTFGPVLADEAYSSSKTIDWAKFPDNSTVRITLTGNITFTFSNGRDGQVLKLELTQDGSGSRTVTWPGAARFSTDIPSPSLTGTASKMERFLFVKTGANYDLAAHVKEF